MRNDRYVVPYPQRPQRSASASSTTLRGAGRPSSWSPTVIELINDLKMADAELAREERRILRSLTENVGFAAAVIHWPWMRPHVDIVHAKAVLARDLNASVLAVDDEPGFILKAARHPVLVLRGIEVVPNDLNLGGDTRALILATHTGGKTVTLKTLGPRRHGARRAARSRGRRQSRRVVGPSHGYRRRSGCGRRPLDASAGTLNLAEILSTLDAGLSSALCCWTRSPRVPTPCRSRVRARDARGMLDAYPRPRRTTRTGALSGADARFVNARVEFDGDRVPTYRLTVGQAGSSHALDVAAALGVEGDILERARSYLGHAAMQVEDMLASVEAQLLRAERARVEAEEAEEAEQQRARADLIRRDLEKERRGIERTVRSEFQREARATASR